MLGAKLEGRNFFQKPKRPIEALMPLRHQACHLLQMSRPYSTGTTETQPQAGV